MRKPCDTNMEERKVKISKGSILADGSLCLGVPKLKRGWALSELKSIGFNSPNFVTRFDREGDLAVHWARRINATVNKRQTLFALLYAESRRGVSIQVGGALKQDRTGSSSIKESLLSGTQAGHIAIGTYSISGEVVSQQGLLLLKDKSADEITRVVCPCFSSLVAFGLALDTETELVPAYINQSSGKIESDTIYYMKGLLPIYIPDTSKGLERQLIVESHRMVDFFIDKKIALLEPMENRIKAIKNKKAKEYFQDQNDKKNQLFEGKESKFLEASLELFTNPSSEFYKELDGLTLKNISVHAADLTEKAEAAKEELADT